MGARIGSVISCTATSKGLPGLMLIISVAQERMIRKKTAAERTAVKIAAKFLKTSMAYPPRSFALL